MPSVVFVPFLPTFEILHLHDSGTHALLPTHMWISSLEAAESFYQRKNAFVRPALIIWSLARWLHMLLMAEAHRARRSDQDRLEACSSIFTFKWLTQSPTLQNLDFALLYKQPQPWNALSRDADWNPQMKAWLVGKPCLTFCGKQIFVWRFPEPEFQIYLSRTKIWELRV